MKIGYARISTLDQNHDLQFDALKQAGCEKIFSDKVSGAKVDRPGLQDALDYLRKDDCLVVVATRSTWPQPETFDRDRGGARNAGYWLSIPAGGPGYLYQWWKINFSHFRDTG